MMVIVPAPGGARRLDEIEVAHLCRRGLGDAADRRREHQRKRDHAVHHAAAHRAGDRDREQHGRERIEHVHRAHDRRVDALARESADDAETAADEVANSTGTKPISSDERAP